MDQLVGIYSGGTLASNKKKPRRYFAGAKDNE